MLSNAGFSSGNIPAMKKRFFLWCINKFLIGTRFFKTKARLLRFCGFSLGNNVRLVGPIFCTADLVIGDNVWIGAFFKATGNGTVHIGNNVDIAPEVTIGTGSHLIGDETHRAGFGFNKDVIIGNGCWIGQQTYILAGSNISDGIVCGARSVVIHNLDTPNGLYVGHPAKLKRILPKEAADPKTVDN